MLADGNSHLICHDQLVVFNAYDMLLIHKKGLMAAEKAFWFKFLFQGADTAILL